jgi:FixJ family two-component response regulator
MQEKNTVARVSKISVVDDDESMREAIMSLIGAMGMSVEQFSSAEEFLNSARSPIDCLILDVRMPGLTGLQLQRRLLADKRSVPIVFITAHYLEPERKTAMAAGAVAFLSKPFTEQELLNAINESLAVNRESTDGSGGQARLD